MAVPGDMAPLSPKRETTTPLGRFEERQPQTSHPHDEAAMATDAPRSSA